MSKMIRINEDDFQEEVLKSQTPVLVDFGAAWCPPCRAMEPILEELARSYGDRAKVAEGPRKSDMVFHSYRLLSEEQDKVLR